MKTKAIRCIIIRFTHKSCAWILAAFSIRCGSIPMQRCVTAAPEGKEAQKRTNRFGQQKHKRRKQGFPCFLQSFDIT